MWPGWVQRRQLMTETKIECKYVEKCAKNYASRSRESCCTKLQIANRKSYSGLMAQGTGAIMLAVASWDQDSAVDAARHAAFIANEAYLVHLMHYIMAKVIKFPLTWRAHRQRGHSGLQLMRLQWNHMPLVSAQILLAAFTVHLTPLCREGAALALLKSESESNAKRAWIVTRKDLLGFLISCDYTWCLLFGQQGAHTYTHTHTYTLFVVVWVLSIVWCCCCFYTLLPTFLYVAKLQNVQRLRLRLRRRRHRRVRWLWLWRIKYIEKQLAAILTWPPFPRSSADPAKGACLPDALLSLVFLHWVRASNFKWETFQPVKSKTGIETGHTRTRGANSSPPCILAGALDRTFKNLAAIIGKTALYSHIN